MKNQKVGSLAVALALMSSGGCGSDGGKQAAEVAPVGTLAPATQACETESGLWVRKTVDEWQAGGYDMQATPTVPPASQALREFGQSSPYVSWISAASVEATKRRVLQGETDFHQYVKSASIVFCGSNPRLESRGYVSTLPIEQLLPGSAESRQPPPAPSTTPPASQP